METVGRRLEKCPMEIRYAYQEMDKMLPEGYPIPRSGRSPGAPAIACCAPERNRRCALCGHQFRRLLRKRRLPGDF